jgi:hypothetical protein
VRYLWMRQKQILGKINLSLGSLPGSEAFEVIGSPAPICRAVAYAHRRAR